MDTSRGSSNNTVIDFDSAKRILEYATVGQNELWKQSEHQKQMPITRTLFDTEGNITESITVSPATWRQMRREGKI